MEAYERYRPLLFSVATRMTGSLSEAEDLVQETFVRLLSRPRPETTIHSLKAFLLTVLVHLCRDYLKSARRGREYASGLWLPEPGLASEFALWPQRRLEQEELLSQASVILLERLTAQERAIFLLHEGFDYSFPELGELLGKSVPACRQVFHRAQQHLGCRSRRFALVPQEHRLLLDALLLACSTGDLDVLIHRLVSEALAWAGRGGKTRTSCGH